MTFDASTSPGNVLTLYAPLTGIVVSLDDVPDPTFAQRLAGDGVSIDPLGDHVLAPCDARVLQVHRAGHALTLSADGLEIIIHVGLDTVLLRGEGFTPLVKDGDVVRRGDPLLRFDADLVARKARSLLTEVLIANMDQVSRIETRAGTVAAGRDELMRVTRAQGDGGAVAAAGDTVESAPIVVTADTGLHARPAAVVASTARQYASDIRILKDTREANARSVVAIMALEVSAGDTVRVVARGDDAHTAVSQIAALLASDMGGAHAPVAASTLTAPAPSAPRRTVTLERGVLQGVAASPGIAIGNVFQLQDDDTVIEERSSDPNQERRALDAALATAHQQLETLRVRLESESDSEKAAIFAAHRELLEDPEVLDRAIADIRAGASAAYAWRAAYTAQADRLTALKNPLLAARATDLRDVGRRVLRLLAGRDGAPPEIPPDAIIIAEDLTPSDAAGLDRTRVRAFATTMGSATSHVAILARGLGIPAVAGIDPLALDIAPGTRVVLDGDAGTLSTSVSADAEARIIERQRAARERRDGDLAAASEPARTRDGHRVEVVANLGGTQDAERVVEVGGEGVGLLRTEFLFMDRTSAPDEDEQTRMYEAVARALGPERILVIRTLDVGGDKPLSYLPIGAESNPFLGERGVRLTLNRPELMRTQIRAILRASSSGKVAIMFPMIATLGEWHAAREMVERERVALGVDPIQVGIMVETAAAALLAERFAEQADFLSIGTNDLTQYTLAMDRTNPRLAPQVDALHPAVLKLISLTVAGAHAKGRWVGVCGALASDLDAVPILLGLGVDELSADVPLVPAVKARVRALTLEACRAMAREALDATDGAAVRAIVRSRQEGDDR